MTDQYGRTIRYLRLSLTERCTLQCAYCRAGEGACPKARELDEGAILRIVRALAALGVDKVRLTGGEPMLRKDLLSIIRGVRAIPGIREISMTTNAQYLPGQAKALKSAGLDRVNISVDSLDPVRYRQMTGGGDLQKVLDGIDEALAAGLSPVKLNVVLLRGVNDFEADDFIALTEKRPLDVRFIELMPLGETERPGARVSGDEIRSRHPELTPLPPRYEGQPAREYAAPGHLGRIGFIDPVSHRFCESCNRVRVMSDGMLRPCLGRNSEVSLLPALQSGDDAALSELLFDAMFHKPARHGFGAGFSSDKNMSRIGG